MGYTQKDLVDAIQAHKLDSVKHILQMATTLDINAYFTGWTVLHYAAEEGVVEIVDLLLQVKNIDVNIVTVCIFEILCPV